MEPTPDQIFPSLDHSTAQLFGASFLNQDELDELERVSMVASKGGRKRARFVSSSPSLATPDDTSNDDYTAPNTPDIYRG
ncbi:hypothetical protein CKAH01_10700 [Colletotrichum kahawae]|uniref:Uncharacterized protein n=1 Tax=Colletotrichum kahawae TaxID=34407 RepID=A0AAD9XXY3_COLKA|nr:hypothetical protein CKAH01_10700 [Colletotrichum kahawae]